MTIKFDIKMLLCKTGEMYTKILFPHRFKKAGLVLFLFGLLLGILFILNGTGWDLFTVKIPALAYGSFLEPIEYFVLIEDNWHDELAIILMVLGALLIAFSKESIEDELISSIRLESLVWATFVNYGILLLAVIAIYGLPFLWVMVFNMITLLVFFLIRFNWLLYQTKKQTKHEE